MKHTNPFLLNTVLNKRDNKTDNNNISNYIRRYSENLPNFLVFCIEKQEFKVSHDLYHTFTSSERKKLSEELDHSFNSIKNQKINLLNETQTELIDLLLDDLKVNRIRQEIQNICKNNTHYCFSDKQDNISLQQYIAKNSKYKDKYHQYNDNYQKKKYCSEQLAHEVMTEFGTLFSILFVGFFVSIIFSSFTLLGVFVGGILFFSMLITITHVVEFSFFEHRIIKILSDDLEKVHADAEKKTYTKAELGENKTESPAGDIDEEKPKQAEDALPESVEVDLQVEENEEKRRDSLVTNADVLPNVSKRGLFPSKQPLNDSRTQQKGIETEENKAQGENDSSLYANTGK